VLAYECGAFLNVKDGEFVVVGDVAKPWNCWSTESSEWSEPEHLNFE
jgi:hypothetical protein